MMPVQDKILASTKVCLIESSMMKNLGTTRPRQFSNCKIRTFVTLSEVFGTVGRSWAAFQTCTNWDWLDGFTMKNGLLGIAYYWRTMRLTFTDNCPICSRCVSRTVFRKFLSRRGSSYVKALSWNKYRIVWDENLKSLVHFPRRDRNALKVIFSWP